MWPNAAHRLAQVNIVEQVQRLHVEVQRILLCIRVRAAAAHATRSTAAASAKWSAAKAAAETTTPTSTAATGVPPRLHLGSDPKCPSGRVGSPRPKTGCSQSTQEHLPRPSGTTSSAPLVCTSLDSTSSNMLAGRRMRHRSDRTDVITLYGLSGLSDEQ